MASIINASTAGAGGVITTADASGQLELQTAGVTRQTIDVNGNVGIGTTSPSTLGLTVYKASGSSGCRYSSGTNNFEISINGVDAYVANGANGPLQFWTNGSERMRIDSSGNLLVGTTSNSYGMRVVASGGFSSIGSPQFNITSSNSSTPFEWVLRSGTSMQFYVNNSSVVATLTTSGVWTNASDARYKENIRPVNYGLTEVMQLLPRAYNIIGSDKQEIGFVAQEVEPFIPELVESTTNSVTNEERLSLSYGQLSAVLVKAIQEQQAIITDLKARIEVLEGASA
jgi:hypothetical protein